MFLQAWLDGDISPGSQLHQIVLESLARCFSSELALIRANSVVGSWVIAMKTRQDKLFTK
jgi:hypothetical protein